MESKVQFLKEFLLADMPITKFANSKGMTAQRATEKINKGWFAISQSKRMDVDKMLGGNRPHNIWQVRHQKEIWLEAIAIYESIYVDVKTEEKKDNRQLSEITVSELIDIIKYLKD